MGEVRMINPVTLEDIDHKVAGIFACLDDIYNVPACLGDLDMAFEGLPLPWIKFCIQTDFVLLAKDPERQKNAVPS